MRENTDQKNSVFGQLDQRKDPELTIITFILKCNYR